MSTILVIEDDEAIGENIVELLEIFGFHVRLAPDAPTGLAFIHEKQPDLIFCDVVMPGVDGYELLTVLRSDVMYQTLPLYFITAKSEPVDRERSLALGATGYLVKPFTEEELLNCVCRHLPLPVNDRQAA